MTTLQVSLRACACVLAVAGLASPGCTTPMEIADSSVLDTGASSIDASITPNDASTLDAASPSDAGNDAAVVDDAAILGDAATSPDAAVIDDAGNDGGNDAAVPMVTIGGTIVGLAVGQSLTLGNGATTQDVAGSASPNTFSFNVPIGASYDITVVTAPSTLLCVMYRGSGTASVAVSNLFVGCSTSMDLLSWFPFDGDSHAARGTDWTHTAGSLAYATDRIGREAHALAAAPTGIDYQLAHALDGDSTTVSAQATQLTVTMWALVPSGLTSTTTENLFAHLATTSQSVSAQINWRGAPSLPYFDFYFYWDGGFTMVLTSSTTALDRDHWHHVAIAAAGPAGPAGGPQFVRSIYVDGMRQATTSTCCGWGNSTTFWDLGPTHVERDDLRIYTRMLSDADIAGIYAAENVP